MHVKEIDIQEVVNKQSDCFFRSGVETGVELVIATLKRFGDDYENSELKLLLDKLLKHCKEQTTEAESELDNLRENLELEERTLN